LKEMPKGQSFFLWVHLFGPHDPSSTHRASPKFGTSTKDRYDHELHYTDLQLGRLLRRLRRRERNERIATVITSDHGELFFKKRRYHGVNLHEASIKVPIVISAPDWPVGRTETLASLVDLAPTILAITGAEPAAGIDGDDLAPYVFGYRDGSDRIHLAETWYLLKDGRPSRDIVAAFDGRYKAVHNRVKNLTKVVSQRDISRRPRNLGRKFKGAKRVLKVLDHYIESTSGPIWADQPQ
jgi:arylsulfatase A-like enzyme